MANVNVIDQYVGRQIKLRRLELGLTLQDLADKIGKTFQQIQKYEKAENRVSASVLYQIAEILDTDIGNFFITTLTSEDPDNSNKDLLELAKSFSKIKNPIAKKNVKSMINGLKEQD